MSWGAWAGQPSSLHTLDPSVTKTNRRSRRELAMDWNRQKTETHLLVTENTLEQLTQTGRDLSPQDDLARGLKLYQIKPVDRFLTCLRNNLPLLNYMRQDRATISEKSCKSGPEMVRDVHKHDNYDVYTPVPHVEQTPKDTWDRMEPASPINPGKGAKKHPEGKRMVRVLLRLNDDDGYTPIPDVEDVSEGIWDRMGPASPIKSGGGGAKKCPEGKRMVRTLLRLNDDGYTPVSDVEDVSESIWDRMEPASPIKPEKKNTKNDEKVAQSTGNIPVSMPKSMISTNTVNLRGGSLLEPIERAKKALQKRKKAPKTDAHSPGTVETFQPLEQVSTVNTGWNLPHGSEAPRQKAFFW
jgi:hypothetical protein